MASMTPQPENRHAGHFSAETERELMIARIAALETKFDKIEHDRDQALLWGIRTLGSLLLGLAAWIYNLVIAGKHP